MGKTLALANAVVPASGTAQAASSFVPLAVRQPESRRPALQNIIPFPGRPMLAPRTSVKAKVYEKNEAGWRSKISPEILAIIDDVAENGPARATVLEAKWPRICRKVRSLERECVGAGLPKPFAKSSMRFYVFSQEFIAAAGVRMGPRTLEREFPPTLAKFLRAAAELREIAMIAQKLGISRSRAQWIKARAKKYAKQLGLPAVFVEKANLYSPLEFTREFRHTYSLAMRRPGKLEIFSAIERKALEYIAENPGCDSHEIKKKLGLEMHKYTYSINREKCPKLGIARGILTLESDNNNTHYFVSRELAAKTGLPASYTDFDLKFLPEQKALLVLIFKNPKIYNAEIMEKLGISTRKLNSLKRLIERKVGKGSVIVEPAGRYRFSYMLGPALGKEVASALGVGCRKPELRGKWRTDSSNVLRVILTDKLDALRRKNLLADEQELAADPKLAVALREFRGLGNAFALLRQRNGLAGKMRDGELIAAAKAGDSAAMNALVKKHQPLAIKKCLRSCRDMVAKGEVEKEDVEQAGRIAVMNAVTEYDFWRLVHLTTYIGWMAKAAAQELRRNGSKLVRTPPHVIEDQSKIQKAITLLSLGGKRAEVGEIVVKTGLTNGRVKRALMAGNNEYSIDRKVSIRGRETEKTCAESIAGPEQGSELNRIRLAEVRAALGAIRDERAKAMIAFRYGFVDGESHSLAETGDRFGVSHQTVRNEEAKWLPFIKQEISARFGSIDGVRRTGLLVEGPMG